jgi:hypothetical protein
MKKGKRPGEQFSDYYSQTVMEMDVEWQMNWIYLSHRIAFNMCMCEVCVQSQWDLCNKEQLIFHVSNDDWELWPEAMW